MDLPEIMDMRNEAVINGNPTDSFFDYLNTIKTIIEQNNKNLDSNSRSDWKERKDRISQLVKMYDNILQITDLKSRKYFHRTGLNEYKKRSKNLLCGEERISIISKLIMLETLCEFKLDYSVDAEKSHLIILSPEETQQSEVSKKICDRLKYMERKINIYSSGNKEALEIELVNWYFKLERIFSENIAIYNGIHYMRTLSQLRYHWIISGYYWRNSKFGASIRNFGAWFLLFALWSVSGFGQRFFRFISFFVAFILFFATVYRFTESVKISECRNVVDSLFHSIYFSVVTFTTLGFGDFYPFTTVGKAFAIMEVLIGYVMLAILVHLITKRLNS